MVLSFAPSTWVLDTGAGSHVCNSLQGLRNKRRVKKDGVTLQVGNGASVTAGTVGDYCHTLANGANLLLRDCLYVPNFLCNVISISGLVRDGYSFNISE